MKDFKKDIYNEGYQVGYEECEKIALKEKAELIEKIKNEINEEFYVKETIALTRLEILKILDTFKNQARDKK